MSDDLWNKAIWTNGKRKVDGEWKYDWPSDSFVIVLNSTDSITGQRRTMIVKGDVPEWGKFKRIKE
jgi:hypothetical protein